MTGLGAVSVQLILQYKDNQWQLTSPKGGYYKLAENFANIEDAVKSLIRNDIVLLERSLSGEKTNPPEELDA